MCHLPYKQYSISQKNIYIRKDISLETQKQNKIGRQRREDKIGIKFRDRIT